jgi:glucan phosphoethanolaminetransferase (alkaline phosphatase superfamily)
MSAVEKKSSQMPEFLRRFFVALKRQPSMIALVVLVIAFFQYSLNLTHISDTTAKIQGPGMGLCGFATMLFSMLSLVCFLNAFPKRKKPVIAMVVLMFVMFAVIIFCDIYYSGLITTALTRAENPIKLDASTIYIAQAYNVLQTHIMIEGIGVALVLLMPLYTKLLRKINTSITVEGNGDLGVIDISGED